MKVLSITLKPNLSEGVRTIEGRVVVDTILTGKTMKIELDVIAIGPPALIGGTSSHCYTFRAELKNSEVNYVLSDSDDRFDVIDLSEEDLNRFSGFLDD